MTSIETFSIDSIDFNNPKKTDGLGHLCSLKTKCDEILLPELKIYSSGGIYEEGGLHYIDLLLGRTDKDLYIFMNNLDRHALKCINNQSEKWYGDEVSIDILETFYKKTIRSVDNLPLLRVMIDENVKYLNADDDIIDVNTIKKNMKSRVSININGLRIEDESISLNLLASVVRTATKSKKTVEKTEDTVEKTEDTVELTEENTNDDTVELTEENTNDDTVEMTEEMEQDVKAVETTVEKNGAVEDNTIEATDSDSKSVSSVNSRTSRRSRMSSRTAISSQLSEQRELVKKMHKEAVRAERYANKKRLAAVKAVHELRNLELAEMSSNYNSYNLNDNVSEFIETESYLEN